MPINSIHPQLNPLLPKIDRVLSANFSDVEKFVPPLYQETQGEFRTRVSRASYFNVVNRVLTACLGAIFRKPHEITGPEPLSDFFTFQEFLETVFSHCILTGRAGVLVDYDDVLGSPKLVPYSSEQIINWTSDFVVLVESRLVQDPNDRFKLTDKLLYRELSLDDGVYTVRLWEAQGNDFQVISEIQPLIRGVTLDYIPFFYATPINNELDPPPPMFMSLADLNIQHFQAEVEHQHGLHFVAIPTPWISGRLEGTFDGKEKVIKMGGSNFIQLETNSNIGILEFTGAGLAAIRENIKNIEERMTSLGVGVLTKKQGVESLEALELRVSTENASLISLINKIQNMLTAAMECYSDWAGVKSTLTLNRDLSSTKLSSTEVQDLLNLYSAQIITLEQLLNKLVSGEVLSQDT